MRFWSWPAGRRRGRTQPGQGRGDQQSGVASYRHVLSAGFPHQPGFSASRASCGHHKEARHLGTSTRCRNSSGRVRMTWEQAMGPPAGDVGRDLPVRSEGGPSLSGVRSQNAHIPTEPEHVGPSAGFLEFSWLRHAGGGIGVGGFAVTSAPFKIVRTASCVKTRKWQFSTTGRAASSSS